MASKKQQLAVLKADLAALQAEINEAKQKVMAREIQLEKAILDGKPVDVRAGLKALLDSASTFLTGLQNEKRVLLKRETYLNFSRSTSDDEIQETLPISESSRRKIDDLIEKNKKYLFRTDRWGCVTVIRKRKAVTFAHGEHCALQPGMSIKIYSITGNAEYDVTVVKTNAESDWVLLESGVDLCEEEPIWESVAYGRRYVQLGLSAPHQTECPFAISTGVVSSNSTNVLGHALGSSVANPGDSGGGCFLESSGCLVGINVGCENIPINLEKDTGAQIYDKISSRYAARAHIIPISCFLFI